MQGWERVIDTLLVPRLKGRRETLDDKRERAA